MMKKTGIAEYKVAINNKRQNNLYIKIGQNMSTIIDARFKVKIRLDSKKPCNKQLCDLINVRYSSYFGLQFELTGNYNKLIEQDQLTGLEMDSSRLTAILDKDNELKARLYSCEFELLKDADKEPKWVRMKQGEWLKTLLIHPEIFSNLANYPCEIVDYKPV